MLRARISRASAPEGLTINAPSSAPSERSKTQSRVPSRGTETSVRRFTVMIAAAAMASALLALPSVLPASAATAGFSVSGSKLDFNGTAFLGKGFTLVGAVAPSWCTSSLGEAAASHLTATEMKAARAWHANLIRYQVSQPGLSNTNLSAGQIRAYVSRIKSAVSLAERYGFGVILSMQDQGIACGKADPLPSTATVTAWHNLAPAFAGDPRVMLELYNEPHNGTTPADWQQWKWDVCKPIKFCSVGFQRLIDDVRSWGVPNVLLVDGAEYARTFASVPSLEDHAPGRGIVYAVHPYGVHSSSFEEQPFGHLARTAPVLATEWNYKDCQENPAAEFKWLRSIGVGLTGWAFDIPGTLISNWTYRPTSCTNSSTWVGGAALKSYFATR
jgi:endoglucanase